MPKLSIIVPVYNTEEYLRESLDSLLNQTLKDIEIICINDCSSDNSLPILYEYAQKDDRIKVINLEKNGGLAYVRNVGIKESKSPYIAFIDSDDTVKMNTYELALSCFKDEIDLVCFGIEVVGDCYQEQRISDDEYYRIKYLGKTELTKEVIFNTDVSACSKIFKKSIIEKHLIEFPVGMHYEDACFFVKYIATISKAFYLQDKLYQYKRRPGSIMAETFEKKNSKVIHHLLITKDIYRFLVMNNLMNYNKELFGQMFESYFWFSFRHSSLKAQKNVLMIASKLVYEMSLQDLLPNNYFINCLYLKNFKNLAPNLFFGLDKYFAVRFIDGYKMIYLFTKNISIINKLKLKFKNMEDRFSKQLEQERLNYINLLSENKEEQSKQLEQERLNYINLLSENKEEQSKQLEQERLNYINLLSENKEEQSKQLEQERLNYINLLSENKEEQSKQLEQERLNYINLLSENKEEQSKQLEQERLNYINLLSENKEKLLNEINIQKWHHNQNELILNSLIMRLFIANHKEQLIQVNSSTEIDTLIKKSENVMGTLYSAALFNTHQFMRHLFEGKLLENSFDSDKYDIDLVYLWGTMPYMQQSQAIVYAYEKRKPILILEDGFIRSLTTWADEKALPEYRSGISFTIDDLTSYYDATRSSRLELMLNDDGLIISKEQLNRAENCIKKITEQCLSKYNHQPIIVPKVGREGVRKVLVVDQSFGDMSIVRGLADSNSFDEMLNAAKIENPDADIIIKTHPDTIAGRSGYLTHIIDEENVFVYKDEINPISLIQYVDKVYVCTTQLGFEALLCGKEVHVFGMPFYAGWGLTNDRQKCSRRTKKRTLEEIFYIAYIMYSKYVDPRKEGRCEIEDAIEYLLELRENYFNMLKKS